MSAAEASIEDIVGSAADAHRGKVGPLLPVLHDIQRALGFIPPAAVPHIARALSLSRAEIHGVITFYHDFRSTPPGRSRRFDTRFFTADASAITARIDGAVGPDTELVELVWVPIDEAKRLDMPAITTVALDELEQRVAAGLTHDLAVPFYRMRNRRFSRILL